MEYLKDPNLSDSDKVKMYLQDKGSDQVPMEEAPAPSIPQKDVPLFDQFKNNFSDEAYNKAKADAADQKSGLGWAQFAAGIGDAMAGRSSAQTAQNFDNIRKGIDERTVGDFDKRKKQALVDMQSKKSMDGMDPTSLASQSMRKAIEANFPAVAKQYGDQWKHVAADDLENIFKPLQLKESIEARKEQARILAADRANARQDRADLLKDKEDEKLQGLKTPYGFANTLDDAKQLKEAHESKKNFDSKIQEMIALRKKFGAETMNREAVARGEQLSKDLLLEYKNMAKLGVLSQSDENIINAIIPKDPLELKTFESLTGQDSILSNLEKFKGDSDRDFQNRIATRTRAGINASMNGQPPASAPQKTVVKTQTNSKTGEKRIVYSDGSTEVVSNIAGGR